MRLRWKPRGMHLAAATLATAIALIGAGGLARAQDSTPSPVTLPATISVSGTGIVNVEPDAASITLGVTAVQPSLSEAQAQATNEMDAIIQSLTTAGIDEKDIQTTNYSVNVLQDYDSSGNPSKVTGYQVSNQVTVTVRDLATLGTILDGAVDAGANTIYGIGFIVMDSSAAATQARSAAVADATQHATELAEAAGGTLGRIVSISENYAPAPYASNLAGMEADMAKSVPIQPGTSSISVSVSMTFELNQ